MKERLIRLFEKMIVWVGIVFGLLVSLVTFLLTVKIDNYEQTSMSISFAPYIIVGIIGFLGILLIPAVFKKLQNIPVKIMIRFATIWTMGVAVIWILMADVLPAFDSESLMYAAMAVNGSDDPMTRGLWFGDGAYLERFPFQVPLVGFLVVLLKLFGSNFLVVYQVLNCVAVGFMVYFIIKLAHGYFRNKLATNMTAIFCLLFLPMIFYCTFIYGNLIAIALAFASWYFQLCVLREERHRKRNIWLAVICMVLAVVFKQTIIIAAIAAAVVWVVMGLRDRKSYIAIAVVEVILAYFATPGINFIVERFHPDLNLHSGTPQIAWVAMGVGAGKEYKADIRNDETLRDKINTFSGYFDGFVYDASGTPYSPEETTRVSSEYLKKRIEHYQEDPGLMLGFFGNKLVVEWAEPTFESILASNWCRREANYVMCERDYTLVAEKIYYGKANQVILFVMDVVDRKSVV